MDVQPEQAGAAAYNQFEDRVLTAPGAAERVAAMEAEMRAATDEWDAPDGTRWVKTPGQDEWTGWVPGEDGCWLYTGDELRRAYNTDIGTPLAPTWHCWGCKWKGDHAGAVEHAEAEPTHKVTRTSDTWHGHGPTDA